MKLRRTLSAAAATAAIVPAALLSATAAHADGGPSPSSSASASASPSGPAAGATPSASATPSAPPSEPGAGSPSPSPSESSPPAPCNNGPSSMVHFSLKGLPGKIVAGGGWSTFTLTVVNTTGTDVGAVEASVSANNGEASENGDLFEHAWLEYWDAGSGKWLSLKDEGKDDIRETGIIYGYTSLKAHQSAVLKFRLEVDAEATPGPSYAIGGGTYVDPAEHCTDGTTVEAGFDVLAPGSTAGGSAQGGKAPAADTGSLAETGSSSATPVIAAAGALAVVAGAGTVLMMRRRRNGSQV